MLYIEHLRIVEFANNVDPDKAVHDEPLYLDLHCLTSILRIFLDETFLQTQILQTQILQKYFLSFAFSAL